jgi:ArsR family transcriptional regulator, arsenate/arsenite/antimonite-responsive transcriptional repressor
MTEQVCATTSLAEPMDREQAEQLARRLKAIADPARLQLLSLLRSSATGEACVCDLIEPLQLSQPTVSHHLRILAEAGLVTKERRGTWSHYSIDPDALAELSGILT